MFFFLGIDVYKRQVLIILISFSLEKLLSAVAVVTGRVKNSKHAVITSGKLEGRLLKFINNNSASSLMV